MIQPTDRRAAIPGPNIQHLVRNYAFVELKPVNPCPTHVAKQQGIVVAGMLAAGIVGIVVRQRGRPNVWVIYEAAPCIRSEFDVTSCRRSDPRDAAIAHRVAGRQQLAISNATLVDRSEERRV